MDKIKQTEAELIEKYGEPEEKIVNGVKYKFVNVYLKNFNTLMEIFNDIEKLQRRSLSDSQIAVICDFALNEVQLNVENVIRRLERYRRSYNRRNNNYADKLQKLFKDFDEYYISKDYNPLRIIDIFVEDIDSVDYRSLDYRSTF